MALRILNKALMVCDEISAKAAVEFIQTFIQYQSKPDDPLKEVRPSCQSDMSRLLERSFTSDTIENLPAESAKLTKLKVLLEEIRETDKIIIFVKTRRSSHILSQVIEEMKLPTAQLVGHVSQKKQII